MSRFVLTRVLPALFGFLTLLTAPWSMHVAFAQGPTDGFTVLTTAGNYMPPLPANLGGGMPQSGQALSTFITDMRVFMNGVLTEEYGANGASTILNRTIANAWQSSSDSTAALRSQGSDLMKWYGVVKAARAARAAAYAASLAQKVAPKSPGFGFDLFFFVMFNPCAGWEGGRPADPQTCYSLTGWTPGNVLQ